jgi:3-oxoacyl-[acyl-carrier protein] reductase
MDLGLQGRKAIVMASSRGLGLACASALAREGCLVVLNGRDQERLDAAAAAVAGEAHGERPKTVVGDVRTEEGRQALLAACPEPDILVTNNEGPPPGGLETWTHDAILAAMEANMIAPMLMIRAVLPGMQARKFGRVINITSAMVKSPRPQLGLSTAARTALTALCKAIAPSVAVDNVTINNLLPERIDTGRQAFMVKRAADLAGITIEQARANAEMTIAAKRFGRPEEFGRCCAYLCSADAGFITGQNIQLDGGSYAGLI